MPQAIAGNLFELVGGSITFPVSNNLLIYLVSRNCTVLFNGIVLSIDLGLYSNQTHTTLGMIVVEMHFRVTFHLYLPRLPFFFFFL